MHHLTELKIWNKSLDLAMNVYKVSAFFSTDERFGLTSQIRRAAVSISSTISEGAGRNTKGEFRQFLGVANGSCYELQTQLIIAERLGFINSITNAVLLNSIDELQKMNYSFQKMLTSK
jgi:four helix bundle protein